MERTFKKVRSYIRDTGMLSGVRYIIAGVSGGSDSMAMLDLLDRLSAEYGYSLEVVHVNHGIRGDEALRDERLVKSFCAGRGISCEIFSLDVPAMARENGEGFEEAGRRARRQAFERAEAKYQDQEKDAVRIGLAHNKNDLAETMLHHLARGTGVRGLCPIKPAGGGIIRPVLCLKRTEIEEYIKARNLPCVMDSTNLKNDYTRNRIRNHILPLLEQEVNPRTVEHMADTAVLFGQAEEFLKTRAEAEADRLKKTRNEYFLDEDFFRKEEILKSYTVRVILERLAAGSKDLEAVHIRQILDLSECQCGKKTELPYGIGARRTYRGVVIRNADAKITVPCVAGELTVKKISYSGQKFLEKKYTKWLDCAKIKSGLSVRTRKTGDYMVIGRHGETKKLTRVMIDDKIPGEIRDMLPVVACGSEIVWIIGGRVSEKYRITSDTTEVLEITYQGGNTNA